MIGFPNRADAATLSGGSWTAGLPRANMQNRIIGKVARTSNDALSSTKFDIDLTSTKKIRALALVNHNLSLNALYRVRATNESAATNLCLQSEVLGNASWTKTNTTVSTNSVAAPDSAVTADTLTASAGNATTIQDLGSLGSAAYVFSIWLKRLTGSGNIDLTLDGGATWTTKTITSEWVRYQITQTLANPDCGIRIVTNGDAIYAWGAQVETGAVATSYYPTTNSTATRAAGYMDAWQSYLSDSGWQDVWTVVYPSESLEWEDDNWWTGQYTSEEIEGYTTALIHLLESNIRARYWRVELDDTSNPDGYVEIGRLFIGSTWQPFKNMSYGASNAWETKTDVQEAIGGAEYFQRRTPFRIARFALNWMSENEGMANAFELQRRAGIDQEVLWIHDPDDTVHALRRRFLGRLRQLSAIEHPYPNTQSTGFEIKEVL
jgi:hypothetical protein